MHKKFYQRTEKALFSQRGCAVWLMCLLLKTAWWFFFTSCSHIIIENCLHWTHILAGGGIKEQSVISRTNSAVSGRKSANGLHILTPSILGKIFNRRHIEIILLLLLLFSPERRNWYFMQIVSILTFPTKKGSDISCKLSPMFQILFSGGKIRKYITNLSSVEISTQSAKR